LEALEVLEGRRLLSSGHGLTSSQGPGAAEVAHRNDGPGHDNNNDQNPNRGNQNQAPQEVIKNGKVVKAPNFYEIYLQNLAAGATPRQDLNVREASAELKSHGRLVLTGKMNAKIDLTKDSFFVWGFDRNGNLGLGSAPFTNRPNIRFDAVVVVQVTAGGTVTGSVRDLVSPANNTTLPAGAIKINGDTVKVTVDDAAHALPSTGLPLSQYRFNLWPRVALGASSTVVSFAPENGMAQIGHSDD